MLVDFDQPMGKGRGKGGIGAEGGCLDVRLEFASFEPAACRGHLWCKRILAHPCRMC